MKASAAVSANPGAAITSGRYGREAAYAGAMKDRSPSGLLAYGRTGSIPPLARGCGPFASSQPRGTRAFARAFNSDC